MGKVTSRVWTVFAEAMEIADAKERAAFISSACGADLPLRQEVEELLQAEAQSGHFLPDRPRFTLVDHFRLPNSNSQQLGEQNPGARIDRYKLLQKIGEGGYGIVYMAEQERPVRRRVALKVIKLGMDTRNVVARFEAERCIHRQLASMNLDWELPR